MKNKTKSEFDPMINIPRDSSLEEIVLGSILLDKYAIDKIISEFQYKFKHNDNFERISKPEICDVLISTDSFRNPWFSEENQEKRSIELKQIQQVFESRKKELEEHNIHAVKDFKKIFINLNHREPTDSEIITNLQESIEIETLKRIIDNLHHEEVENTNEITVLNNV